MQTDRALVSQNGQCIKWLSTIENFNLNCHFLVSEKLKWYNLQGSIIKFPICEVSNANITYSLPNLQVLSLFP